MKGARHTVELLLAAVGALLVLCTIAASQAWLDRHFLPSFVVGRVWYVRIETGVRILVAAIGVVLAVIARRRVARILVDERTRVMQVALAVVLAILAAEAVLRKVSLRPAE